MLKYSSMTNIESPKSPYREILAGILSYDDVEKSSRFLEGLSLKEFGAWILERTCRYSYGDQRFQMVVDRPTNGNDGKAVVVLSEFGTNILPRFVAKSRVMRDMVDPEATLIVQPSSVIGEANMNYSLDERLRLYHGNLSPIIGRIAVTLAENGRPRDVTMFGSSQGGMIGLECASSKILPPVSVAMYDVPTVIDRSYAKLAMDFAGSGGDLANIVRANFDDHDSEFARQIESDASTIRGMATYAMRMMHPDNLATAGAMRFATASDRIEKSLKKGGSVVQVWGNQDEVSPDHANREIAERYKSIPRYAAIPLEGVSHALPDFYAFDGAVTRLAHDLKK